LQLGGCRFSCRPFDCLTLSLVCCSICCTHAQQLIDQLLVKLMSTVSSLLLFVVHAVDSPSPSLSLSLCLHVLALTWSGSSMLICFFCVEFINIIFSRITCTQYVRYGLLLQMLQVCVLITHVLNRLRCCLGANSCGSKEQCVKWGSRLNESVHICEG